ncbi:MAG: LysR family transcriptional regulator [Pseudomonadota bacterium]|nr:LysR family transcriptional regulator [Pseudomonadota bacterium]
MNLRFLEAFVWVARLSSFKAAADKLCTTQAGISSRIATLEEQLGTRLFERDRRSVTLTFDGTELLPLAEKMLRLQSQMQSRAGQRDNLSGMLRIGVMETVVHTWLPALLSRFSRLHPNITIELHSDTSPHLRDELLRGRLDVAFQTELITEGFVENRLIARLAMRWVAAPTLPLPPGTLCFADIASQPIISFHRESIVYRSILQSAESHEGKAALRVNFFSSLAAMIELAKTGFGVAPLPVAVVQAEVARGELLLLDVEPALQPLPVCASQRIEPGSPVIDELIALAESCCNDFLARGRPDLAGAPASAAHLSVVTRKT